MHIYEDHINDYFLKNKYSKWYFSIINNALSCNRKKSKNVYFEAHHILPAAAFPEYKRFSLNRWNKVLLTSKEHYIVHLLLPFTTDNKSHKAKYLKAFKIICFNSKNQQRYTSKMYHLYREAISNSYKGEFNSQYGVSKIYGENNNSCPVICEGKYYSSIKEAQQYYGNICIFPKLDNPRYPEFYRLRPKHVFADDSRKLMSLATRKPSANKVSAKGKKWYYNPNNKLCSRFLPGTEPIGWVPGKLHKNHEIPGGYL
jgi:hypothetical protein